MSDFMGALIHRAGDSWSYGGLMGGSLVVPEGRDIILWALITPRLDTAEYTSRGCSWPYNKRSRYAPVNLLEPA